MASFKIQRKNSQGQMEDTSLSAKELLEDGTTLSKKYVTTGTAQEIKGSKTFSGVHNFTGETKFTNSQFCPTFTDVANGIGKSSCFTRGAFMQSIIGQIIAPNTNVSDSNYSYDISSGTLKFQRITNAAGKNPTLKTMATMNSSGLNVMEGGIKINGTSLENKFASMYSWNAIVKGSTYSRLCYVAAGQNVEGCSYIISISATRNSVVYNDTYIVKNHHSSKGSIVKISGSSYSTGLKVRTLSDSGGNSYFELFDNANSATSSITQTVHCRLLPLFTGAITTYSVFTDGTTLPTNFIVGEELTTTNKELQASLSWNDIADKPTIPTNYVTTNTEQTISKKKSFTGSIASNIVETGTGDSNYFQSRKFRGEGDASKYYHAIDFGYANHNQFDFYEYGGLYNFYKNESGTKDGGTLIASITPEGIKEVGTLLKDKYAAKTDLGADKIPMTQGDTTSPNIYDYTTNLANRISSVEDKVISSGMTLEKVYSATSQSSFTISNASSYKMFIFRISGYGDLDKYVVAPNNFANVGYGSEFTSFQVVYHVSNSNQLDYVTLSYNKSTDKITVTNTYETWGAWGFVGIQLGVK